MDLRTAVAAFGRDAKAKLANPGAAGQPEDQLRAPLEQLLKDLAEAAGLARGTVEAVGEASLADLKTRPDYAVTVRGALVGFVEVKAPGKGADPRRFRDAHDRAQWDKLRSLPNLLYTDGNEFALWRNGELAGAVVRLEGDVEAAGARLAAPPALLATVADFLQWAPASPRSVKQLAEVSARLCRLLREEVGEQMAAGSKALTGLASDWRKLLFPEASDAQFADGYAQAVTFGLLVARARGIALADGVDRATKTLAKTNSLIGAALRLLTDDAENQATLNTSLGTLVRVLDAVDWATVSRGRPDAWLYFYEEFLQVYDPKLRRQTGSYYTPPEVVDAMVRLVDEVLAHPDGFALRGGLAAPEVTVVDPAVGTGTFLLGAVRQLARRVAADEGEGAVPAALAAAVRRLVGFELQLGPFAVAQLRVLAECAALAGPAARLPRMYVTDTLGNPYAEQESLGSTFEPIAESRRKADAVKRDERITVVVGNPPYKEKAKGRGGWVEAGGANAPAPFLDWVPPADWGVGAHAKHLRNLYVYFWRWATWKVFDAGAGGGSGIVCFITVAGFLDGDGFQRMRDYLRRKADAIWVIDCSPEGHQPDVGDRIFEGVQQPVCVVLASRTPDADESAPAAVRFRALPAGPRRDKFAALGMLALGGDGWQECPSDWRAPFLPASAEAWAAYPALDELFVYNGSGVMPGRTWVIAPDRESLARRWQALVDAPADRKEALFHPHLLKDGLGDRHVHKVLPKGLPGFEARPAKLADERGAVTPPVRYGFRSFDRQWIIPDNRVINRPNPTLWTAHSERQVYLTVFQTDSPTSGPALTFSAAVPDLHHYKGSFGGRVFPLWQDREATVPNVRPALLDALARHYGAPVSAEDVLAYVAAVAAHPAYTARFQPDLATPGLRIPLTADAALFAEAAALGRAVVWLHTYGERFADPAAGRPSGPPRVAGPDAPHIPREGAIPAIPDAMPDTLTYDAAARRLHVGDGFVDGVDPRVWAYEVSGKPVLRQWFSYRRRSRERPLMGDRRPPSKLGDVQPDHWVAEYTSELLNLLHVLTRLVALEPDQASLLERVCAGRLFAADVLRAAGALDGPAGAPAASRNADEQHTLLLA